MSEIDVDVVKIALEWGARALTWSWENLFQLFLAALILWVKYDFNKKAKVTDSRYALKYQACMDALKVIDAKLCSIGWDLNGNGSFDLTGADMPRQYVSAEFVRSCHASLQITCTNKEILDKFNSFLFGDPKKNDDSEILALKLLEFRRLVKIELGFKGKLPEDKKQIWFSGVCFARQSSQDMANTKLEKLQFLVRDD